MSKSAAIAIALLLLWAGCVANDPVGPCGFSSDCPSGYVCIDGLCRSASGPPSGTRPDATPLMMPPVSTDAGVVTGPGSDAGRPDSAPVTDAGSAAPDASPVPDAAVTPDTGPSCVPGAETCNNLDEDCDGRIDESLMRACSSACGSGTERCVSGTFTGCDAPTAGVETCNGTDEDCDGRIDESLMRACSSACGSGTETCSGGSFGGCSARMPSTETCNNTDEDCDGRIDEGVTMACSTMCGGGTQTCSAGTFGACSARTPTPETCNGIDDDCNGSIDGIRQACSTACGSGEQVCSGGSFGACSARAPVAETCNRSDDDCNGVTDDNMRAALTGPSIATLQTFQNLMNASNVATVFGNSAANRYCNSTCGGRSGLIVESNGVATGTMCVGVDTFNVPFSTLQARHPSCTFANISTIFCASAVHRECGARGYASGIGPLETDGTNAVIGCMQGPGGPQTSPTARALVEGSNFSRLDDFIPQCTAANAQSLACRAAANRLCQSLGRTSGFGPVEASGDLAIVVCVNP